MAIAMIAACSAIALARSGRPDPSARATADDTPPPIAPADIICIRVWIGNTSATEASAVMPSRPTNHASAKVVSVIAAATTTLGADSRASIGAIGPCNICSNRSGDFMCQCLPPRLRASDGCRRPLWLPGSPHAFPGRAGRKLHYARSKGESIDPECRGGSIVAEVAPRFLVVGVRRPDPVRADGNQDKRRCGVRGIERYGLEARQSGRRCKLSEKSVRSWRKSGRVSGDRRSRSLTRTCRSLLGGAGSDRSARPS